MKRGKVIRIERSEDGLGFQVINGFRVHIARHYVQLDFFGWRISAQGRERYKSLFYYFNNLNLSPPFNYLHLNIGPLLIKINRAYGGFVLEAYEND